MPDLKWYENRTCKLVSCNRNIIVLPASSCQNPIWIFEGIARVLHLTDIPFPIHTASKVRECEKQLIHNGGVIL